MIIRFHSPHFSNDLGLLFYCLMFSGSQAIQTVPILFNLRRVFYYQSASGYFRPIVFFISLALIQ